MKISYWLLATFCLTIFGCGGNRYYKNYNGERFPKTKWCNLINAEVEYYNTGRTLEDQIRQLQSEGYRVIGTGENDAVVSCDDDSWSFSLNKPASYSNAVWGVNPSFGSSSCVRTKLDAENQKKVVNACRAIGGNKALYDSQRIIYLREIFSTRNEEKEDDARSKCVRRKDYIKTSLLCNKCFHNSNGFYWNPIEEKCQPFQGRTEAVEEISALADESSRPSD